jgi:hypothetical protein
MISTHIARLHFEAKQLPVHYIKKRKRCVGLGILYPATSVLESVPEMNNRVWLELRQPLQRWASIEHQDGWIRVESLRWNEKDFSLTIPEMLLNEAIKLGKGTYGTVYIAEMEVAGGGGQRRRVALKLFHCSKATNGRYMAGKEARNALKVYYFCVFNLWYINAISKHNLLL